MQAAHIEDMHRPEDSQRNEIRIRRMLVIFGIMTLVAAALITASLIWRDPTHMNNPNETMSQVITIAITLVWGALVIFLWGMKLSPRLSYRKYLKEIHGGLSRYEEGIITSVDEQTSFRDGLSFYGMILNIGDLENPEDERLLYWDAQLGKPTVSAGDKLRIHAHGNDIIGFERA